MAGELTWRWFLQGYPAAQEVRERAGGGDDVPARVLGRRVAVVRSPELVERFYDPAWVRRRGAVPLPLAGLLFGPGAVHGLDDLDHAHRKRHFLGLLDEDAVAAVTGLAERRLEEQLAGGHGDAFDLLVGVYGRAVQEWAGVHPPGGVHRALSRDLADVVAGFGQHDLARAWRARVRSQLLLRREVLRARRRAPHASAVSQIAHWRDRDGSELPALVAATELHNVLRPTVAVAYLGAFGLHALAADPATRELVASDRAAAEAFAQEVRRAFPFAPALAGLTRRPGDWGGVHLPAGHRVVLDVHGVDHDAGRYACPHAVRADRFADGLPGPYDLVPQGGGHPETGHRCPGEPLAVALLTTTIATVAASPVTLTSRGYDERRIPCRARVRIEGVPASPGR